jgi:hypothetical protein
MMRCLSLNLLSLAFAYGKRGPEHIVHVLYQLLFL